MSNSSRTLLTKQTKKQTPNLKHVNKYQLETKNVKVKEVQDLVCVWMVL